MTEADKIKRLNTQHAYHSAVSTYTFYGSILFPEAGVAEVSFPGAKGIEEEFSAEITGQGAIAFGFPSAPSGVLHMAIESDTIDTVRVQKGTWDPATGQTTLNTFRTTGQPMLENPETGDKIHVSLLLRWT